jgi:hypothetical protein
VTLEDGLYTFLTGLSAVTSLVGTRIYPTSAPAASPRPYLVYERPDTEFEQHAGGSAGIAEATLRLKAYGDTPKQARTLIETVQPLLEGFQGLWGTVPIRSVLCGDEGDLFQEPAAGDSKGFPGRFLELDIFYRTGGV